MSLQRVIDIGGKLLVAVSLGFALIVIIYGLLPGN